MSGPVSKLIFRRASGYRFLCLLLALSPNFAIAISFTSFDARSMAMGGAGVASAKSYNALLFNPALLGRSSGERRFHSRAYIGARLIDRDNFIDSVDAFKESTNDERLRAEFREFSRRVDAGIDDESDVREALSEAGDVTAAARALLLDYASLSDKPLRVSASAGLSFGYAAGDSYAIGAVMRRNQMGGAVVRLSSEDLTAIRGVLDTVDALGNAVDLLIGEEDPLPLVTVVLVAMRDNVHVPEEEELTSSLVFEGARATETAIGYSPTVGDDPYRWHWGAALKLVEFDTIDYEERIADAEVADFSDDRYKRGYRDVNFDLGVIRQIDSYWRFGAVIRNVIPYDYQTVRNNTIKLRPLVRIGVAYEPSFFTLTADLDITTNDPVGFDPDKRYLAVGSEWRVWRNSALRAGYRHNTVSGSGLYSLGIGLGPGSAHTDIALTAKGDELGFSLQFAAYF